VKRLRRVEAISSQIRNEGIVEEAKDVLGQTGVMVYGRINHR